MLSSRWHSCAYVFFKAEVEVEVVKGRRCLIFRCGARVCQSEKPVHRFLDTGDRASSGNLFKHARTCWGDEAVEQAMELGDATRVHNTLVVKILQNGRITEFFALAKKGAALTYSNKPLTRGFDALVRIQFVRWVAESYRPFAIVKDPGFLRLMLTGRPLYYIPSPTTISHDLKAMFAIIRVRLSDMLKEYAGWLHFATDGWTSPNHRPFITFTVHLELDGAPLTILDIVELAKAPTCLRYHTYHF
ncbi:hypothetical protein L226DRAFT_473346 [Lentinus tigrinus ALCF2SS1-7]|uniref:DUF659 domain-containing protein n=1 Tax=Lentinus tigrinus ALCF2SS1-6 TaxID=1328759 RepID=A0A5C2RT03_9APHY|nr:hypothetical protein L227DRAFT_513423 [Lentinus tigrinus ALCF2SS1-6]RPD68494.1 hypothetical protein L226DRAFT_473346 [Lentinus tigrinus ALCF2SS1-7]